MVTKDISIISLLEVDPSNHAACAAHMIHMNMYIDGGSNIRSMAPVYPPLHHPLCHHTILPKWGFDGDGLRFAMIEDDRALPAACTAHMIHMIMCVDGGSNIRSIAPV